MKVNTNIDVIIPAFNEEEAISNVIKDIPAQLVNRVVVVDNGSTDNTGYRALTAGAIVIEEAKKGYGNACLKGIDYIRKNQTDSKSDIIVFLDADYSDYPEEIELLVSPIIKENADIVIGSRNNEQRQEGSLTPQQRFGNWLATKMILYIYGYRFSDLGPFRAIKYDRLLEMKMSDTTFGWTVEMQIKALKMKMKVKEVPVKYRPRIGTSKISGTVKGSVLAGYKIISTIIKYSLS